MSKTNPTSNHASLASRGNARPYLAVNPVAGSMANRIALEVRQHFEARLARQAICPEVPAPAIYDVLTAMREGYAVTPDHNDANPMSAKPKLCEAWLKTQLRTALQHAHTQHDSRATHETLVLLESVLGVLNVKVRP